MYLTIKFLLFGQYIFDQLVLEREMKKLLLLLFIFISLTVSNFAQPADLKIGGHVFLNYNSGKTKGASKNKFEMKRGYVNIIKSFDKQLSLRVTPDITLDKEGEDTGSLQFRLKYAYLQYKFADMGFISKPFIQAGVVPRTFFGFQMKINPYRIQGNMFLDRYKVNGTTDYGITAGGLLGGLIDKDYQSKVNKNYPGKYGSFAVGIYNGGGYNKIENNENKVIEGRLTIRLLPALLPGFQLTYFGTLGKGNTADEPDWTVNTAYVSYEAERFVLTGTYYTGTGSRNGKVVNAEGESLEQEGISFFGKLELVKSKFNIFGRYDDFKTKDVEDIKRKGIIAGAAYTLRKGINLVLDYDASKEDDADYGDNSVMKLSLEIKF